MKNPLRYHLRFQIIPGHDAARDARDLADFCSAHRVEEAVLFFAAEEWNDGLLSKRDEDRWFATVAQSKSILEKAGITVSLNPWMTVLHCDRGRTFPKDRPFQPMVSPLGEVSSACASFADPNWLRYVTRLYGRFATLGFRVLWIEDDFRYHNHGPLDWGGGFEPEILQRFARKIGRRVTRDQVVKAILRPGKPHPWRALWMATWREIHLGVAQAIAGSVAKAAPGDSKLGLMSSLPAEHSIEGRDWRRLFENLSIRGQVAHRPHYAAYGDSLGRNKPWSFMMLDVQKQFRPPDCEVAPELENFPFTAWGKSDTQTWSEMALALFYGSDAILLDLFPFTGAPAGAEPQIGRLLDRSRPALEWIAQRFRPDFQTCGVGLPWREDTEQLVHLRPGASIQNLNASSFVPGHLLLPCGVPVSASMQPVNAVFGDMAWAHDDATLTEMLSRGLLLDGRSAEILARRGFGDLLGVRVIELVDREGGVHPVEGGRERRAGRRRGGETVYSLEQVTSARSGVRPGFFLTSNLMPEMRRIEPARGAREWTAILTPQGKRFGAGLVTFRNRLGGRVVTFAAETPSRLPMSYQRQAMVQAAVAFAAGGRFPDVLVTGGPHLIPLHLDSPAGQKIVVLNGSVDPARPVFRFSEKLKGTPRATLLSPLDSPRPVRCRMTRSPRCVTVTLDRPLPYLAYAVLEW